MKRSSKLICGLLMSWLCFRVTGLNEKMSVIQSPHIITVNEGESAEISCCWTKMSSSYVKVFWLKNETRISAENRLYQTNKSENCSTLHITNISPNDTGEYVCKVTKDIPILTEGRGNKTILSISIGRQEINVITTKGIRSTAQPKTDKHGHDDHSSLILYLSLAAVGALLIICLVFSVCKIRNYCKNTERVVIHQKPHSEGEEHENPEEEELSSGSSRGSVQWYQVPVYWSYFDVQSVQDQ